MSDALSAFISGGLPITLNVLTIAIIVWTHFRYRRNEKMDAALDYIQNNIAYGHGSTVIALAMLANGLPRNDRIWAIQRLVTLATLNNNREALLALRDHISPKHLKHALKDLGNGDLKVYLRGNAIGQTHGMKLICFTAGTRPIGHLDSDLTQDEQAMLRDQFNVYQLLKVVEASTG